MTDRVTAQHHHEAVIKALHYLIHQIDQLLQAVRANTATVEEVRDEITMLPAPSDTSDLEVKLDDILTAITPEDRQ